jgi:uncharacterized protein (UPF0297 family)
MDKDKLSEFLLSYFDEHYFIKFNTHPESIDKSDCDKLAEEIIKEFLE